MGLVVDQTNLDLQLVNQVLLSKQLCIVQFWIMQGWKYKSYTVFLLHKLPLFEASALHTFKVLQALHALLLLPQLSGDKSSNIVPGLSLCIRNQQSCSDWRYISVADISSLRSNSLLLYSSYSGTVMFAPRRIFFIAALISWIVVWAWRCSYSSICPLKGILWKFVPEKIIQEFCLFNITENRYLKDNMSTRKSRNPRFPGPSTMNIFWGSLAHLISFQLSLFEDLSVGFLRQNW